MLVKQTLKSIKDEMPCHLKKDKFIKSKKLNYGFL